jgi:septum site-determining protein MinD
MLSPEDVIDILAIKLIGLVPEDESILVSSNKGTPAAMDVENSRAGQAFHNIARRLLGQDVPFLDLEEDIGWFQRFLRALGFGGGERQNSNKSDRKHTAEEKLDEKRVAS